MGAAGGRRGPFLCRRFRGIEVIGKCRPLPRTYFVFSARFRRAGIPPGAASAGSGDPRASFQVSPAGDEEAFKMLTSSCGFTWIISLTVLSVVKVLITIVINADKVASCLHAEFLPKWMSEHPPVQSRWQTRGSPVSYREFGVSLEFSVLRGKLTFIRLKTPISICYCCHYLCQ